MTRILGYDTTTAMEALTAFIAEASAQYDALEQAIAPVDEKIADLQKDWDLRSNAFWSPLLRTALPVIRKATTGCLELFDRKQSHEVPIPLVLSVSVTYTSDLYSVEKSIEEAGILLTAFLRSSGSLSVEQEIRERQRLLRALLALSKAVHEAVDNGRLRLKNAPEEQRKVLSPPKRRKASRAAKHPTHLRIVEDRGGSDEQMPTT